HFRPVARGDRIRQPARTAHPHAEAGHDRAACRRPGGQAMSFRVLLAHTGTMFDGYYGDRALAELSRHAEVVRNGTGAVLSGRALAEAAAGCDAIIADRTTPGLPETFAHAPGLLSFHRCAVDISTID